MLTREAALRDFFDDGRPQTLFPVYQLDRRQDAAITEAEELSSDSREELATLTRQSAAEDRWDVLATAAIGAIDAGRAKPGPAQSVRRHRAVEDFLRANRDYQRSLDSRRVEELKAAAIVPVKLLFVLSVIFGAIALAFVLRRRRALTRTQDVEDARDAADRHYADGQARFGEAMQVAENQSEGHELLIRHLEAGTPDASITVLIRNNSGDRLEPAVALPADSPLAGPLEHAKPRSCLAVRLSRPVDQGPTSDEIITCEVCGAREGESTCQPLLVGGEVIGSVLTSGRRRQATPSAAASTTRSRKRRPCSPTCATSRWP